MTGLKRNSKAILDIIAEQKDKNYTKAYKMIHPNASDVTARNNASQLVRKPEAQIYLQQHVKKARSRIVELVDSEKGDIALRASQDILDRSHGKATTRVESSSTGVTLNIDLFSALDDDITEVENVAQ